MLPTGLPAEVQAVLIEGAPAFGETVLLHAASQTLVVTDLVFHVRAPNGLSTGLIRRLVGAHRKLGQSRALRFMMRDRAAACQSARRVLALDFTRIVMAHGQVVDMQRCAVKRRRATCRARERERSCPRV